MTEDVAPQRLAMTDGVVPPTQAPATPIVTPQVVEGAPPVAHSDGPVAQVVSTRVVETLRAAVVAVVSAIQVSPTLATTGVGEIRIELNNEILDGSTVRFEAKKGGELAITVHPATPDAARVLERHLETFQAQLAERVTAWRVSVGVSAWNPRMNLKQTEREA